MLRELRALHDSGAATRFSPSVSRTRRTISARGPRYRRAVDEAERFISSLRPVALEVADVAFAAVGCGARIVHVCKIRQNAHMKSAALSVRIPEPLKRKLIVRARRERRSLSAQVEYELARSLTEEEASRPGKRESFLGMFKGARVPTDNDFAEARSLLWGRLNRRSQRG
jgi:hypothetical protein